MGKLKEKQQKKRQLLLETAFQLFTSKGINETTIQDIVKEAGIAKGTFYLYFKDKYDLVERLRRRKAAKLFEDAIYFSKHKACSNFVEQFLEIIDYIIDELSNNPELLRFIYKNLSMGAHHIELEQGHDEQAISIFELFKQHIQEENIALEDPDTTFFMIIELVGASCYNAILFEVPLPIEAFKPHLYRAIRQLLMVKE